MAVFHYKGVDKKGKNREGFIDSDSISAAERQLEEKDIYPTKLSEMQSDAKGTGKFFGMRRRLSLSDTATFLYQLSVLTNAGLPIMEALETISRQAKDDKKLRLAVHKIKERIAGGHSLASAFHDIPVPDSELFVKMMETGEAVGNPAHVFSQLGQFYEKKLETRKKIWNAAGYPVFMLALGAGVLVFLMTYVVPTIKDIFTESNNILPLPTRMLLVVTGNLQFILPALLGLMLCFLLTHLLLINKRKYRYFIDSLWLKLPVFGSIYNFSIGARTISGTAEMLRGGVNLPDALRIVRGLSRNSAWENAVQELITEIEKGGRINSVLEDFRHFPPVAAQIIGTGEKTGELAKTFGKAAEYLETEFRNRLTRFIAVLEPSMIMVLSFIVGFIALAVLMPIFNMSSIPL